MPHRVRHAPVVAEGWVLHLVWQLQGETLSDGQRVYVRSVRRAT